MECNKQNSNGWVESSSLKENCIAQKKKNRIEEENLKENERGVEKNNDNENIYEEKSNNKKRKDKNSNINNGNSGINDNSKNKTGIGKRLIQGCTNLMYACQQGLTGTVIKELRTKPERIRDRDRSNKTALHYCCGQRDLVAAASIAVAAPELLESADEDGFTPLHLAVIQGNMAMVNLLLANKADVNALDNEGHSVVHWATVCGEVEALHSVLTAGANVAIPDINGGSPLHYAAQMCGADYEGKVGQASTKLALEILQILLNHPHSSVDVVDKDGRQPLLWAASAGSAKAIILLVKAGARIESADKDGLTALHCAASRGHTECIDTLISLCGAPTDLIDLNGCTALHYAVTLGHADATSRLLDLEADPNRQDRKGRTPAHCGCAKGQFETVKILRERGANLWLRNAKGDLPVHEAASSGRRELVEWLLEQKPNQVNTTSNDGRSLLHIAAGNDYTDMCKMLLDFGADINSIYRNSKGVAMTPLDCALQKGFRSTAKFLQSNRGLPASKLRLSARRPNAFNDQELVKPLRYIEKEEIYDLNTGKSITHMKKSDSESADCSCTEKQRKKKHTTHHVCRHHRKKFRRRTSSCGEAKDFQKEDDGTDVFRSKSNLEIRTKKSRERIYSSGEDDEDSCENCCKHKKRLKIKRKERFLRRSRERIGSDIEIEEKYIRRERKISKNNVEEKSEEIESVIGRRKIDEHKLSRPASANRKRPQSAKKRQKQISTFAKSPGIVSMGLDLTDEDEIPKSEQVVTEVEVHKADDEVKEDVELEKITDSQKTEEAMNDVIEEVSKKVEEVLEDAAKVVEVLTESQVLDKDQPKENENDSKKATEDKVNEEAEKEEKQQENEVTVEADLKADKPEDNEPKETIDAEQLESAVKRASDEPSNEEAIAESTKPSEENDVAAILKESSQQKPQDKQEEIEKEKDKEGKVEKRDNNVEVPEKNEEAAGESKQTEEIESNEQKVKTVESERNQEGRRSFTLLPDSSDENKASRKGSFTVLKSDESIDVEEALEKLDKEQDQSFQVVKKKERSHSDADYSTEEICEGEYDDDGDGDDIHDVRNKIEQRIGSGSRFISSSIENGRKKRLKRRMKNSEKQRSIWKTESSVQQQTSKDQDSGFEPSPRAIKTKIPSPRTVHTAYLPRKPIYATLDGRSCSSRVEGRKPGDRGACNMTAVTRSIQRNIRRYYMEKKIFQHLLELKSLQIRSSKLNESVLVKRAVDDYHKSCIALGSETGGTLRRYPYTEYTFKNFEMFLYETLKSLQKPGTYNFQNINEVYEEAERRLSPDYKAYQRALHCTAKTHRCLHATHAYTGIPCAAYIPMMNHHTIPKLGFGQYKKTGVGSFFLPKILTHPSKCGNKVSLELSHGKSKQLISLPSDKLHSNKRYYVTFTVKDSNNLNGNNKILQQQSDSDIGIIDKL